MIKLENIEALRDQLSKLDPHFACAGLKLYISQVHANQKLPAKEESWQSFALILHHIGTLLILQKILLASSH